jgi:DNA polymerase (family 10)
MPGLLLHKINDQQNNKALASIFLHMADCYRYLGNDDRFRAIAYDKVGKVLTNMKKDIAVYATDVKTLDEIGGIGESIARKIIEYLQTGKIRTFEKLKKEVPYQLLELMDITGFGPATLKLLHEKLNISDREDLMKALENNKLHGLKGFGEKKIENMKRSLKLYKESKRLLLKDAQQTGNKLLSEINKIPGVEKAALAGSLRRKKDTIGDIDIVIQARPGVRKKMVNRIISMQQVEKVLAKGITKASVLLKKGNMQVDIRIVNEDEFGAAMLYFTGSKEHNIKLRMIAKQRGYKINEYGIFDAGTNQKMAGRTEEEMYRFLQLRYIPPEQRLDKGEIEKAMLTEEYRPTLAN